MTRKLSDSHYVNIQERTSLLHKFATWYSEEVQKQVDSRVNFEDVNVERKLSVLKPMQLGWWKFITFSPAHRGGSCLERMGESGNKGCSNWKRSIAAC